MQQIRNLGIALGAGTLMAIAVWVFGSKYIEPQTALAIPLFACLVDIMLEVLERENATKRFLRGFFIPLVSMTFVYASLRVMVAVLANLPIKAIAPLWSKTATNPTITQSVTIEFFFLIVGLVIAYKARPRWEVIPADQPNAGGYRISRQGSCYRYGFFWAAVFCFSILTWQSNHPAAVEALARVGQAKEALVTQGVTSVAQDLEQQIQPRWGVVKPQTRAFIYDRSAAGFSQSQYVLWAGAKVMEVVGEMPKIVNGMLFKKVRWADDRGDFYTPDPTCEAWVKEGDFVWIDKEIDPPKTI